MVTLTNECRFELLPLASSTNGPSQDTKHTDVR